MGIYSDFMEDFTSSKVDPGLIEYFARHVCDDLPEGLVSYKPTEEPGIFLLSSKEPLTFTFNETEIPTVYKENGVTNAVSLIKYLYANQQSLDISSGKWTIKNYEIPSEKLILSSDSDDSNGNITNYKIIPPKFPEPHYLEIEFGNIKKRFLFERQPYNDLSTVFFKSINHELLSLFYYYDKKEQKFSLSIDFKITQSNSIDEALKYSQMVDYFFKGDIKIQGYPLHDAKIDDSKVASSTRFLQMLKELEYYFQDDNRDFKFNPQLDLSHEEYEFVYQLHYSLIQKIAFRLFQSVNSIEINKSTVDSNFLEVLKKQKNDGVSLELTTTRVEERMLLGQSIKIDYTESFVGVKVVGVDEMPTKFIVTLKNTDQHYSAGFYSPENSPMDTESLMDNLQKAKEIQYV